MTNITVSDILITVTVTRRQTMRDNAKGGALTEVTFYILLSLYTPKHGYAVMQFIEEKTDGRLSLGAGTSMSSCSRLNRIPFTISFSSSTTKTFFAMFLPFPDRTIRFSLFVRILSVYD